MQATQKLNTKQIPATRRGRRMLQLVMLCMAMGMGSMAHAYLGGDSSGIETDRMVMKAAHAVQKTASPAGSYTVHEITLPSGTLVRQYASPAGLVFAVSWKGPFMPDLQQILGAHFQTLVALQKQQSLAGHRSISHHAADLVIESGGRPRSFTGRAYLPGSLPAGVAGQDIR